MVGCEADTVNFDGRVKVYSFHSVQGCCQVLAIVKLVFCVNRPIMSSVTVRVDTKL
jgi:hypothetical protein